MCIRDRVGNEYFAVGSYRPYGGRREVHAGQSARPFPQLTSVSLVQGIQCIVPVSYTHLDVYKRQVQGVSGPRRFVSAGIFRAATRYAGARKG